MNHTFSKELQDKYARKKGEIKFWIVATVLGGYLVVAGGACVAPDEYQLPAIGLGITIMLQGVLWYVGLEAMKTRADIARLLDEEASA